MTDKAQKRDSEVAATAGNKKLKTEVDYSLWEDIGNQLRIDSARAVHVTKSGHPTSSASIADILSVLFFHQSGMKFHPDQPAHFLNDRIVLSKGHAAPALYAAFYRSGILTEAQLLSLRLKDSIIEGHPVPKIPFVDVATGSLGQGLSVAAGMAYSSKHLDHINNRIFCITGDG
jgi:transketolase